VSTPTINRTGILPTDDDGSGTTGTKWNRAFQTAVYDAIDAMLSTSFKQKSANYTVLNTDNVIQVTSGSITLTLHAANDATRGNNPLWIKNSGTGTVTVDGAGSETIDGQLTFTLGQYDSFILVSTGTEWIIF
jgi:hypothetical protein